MVNDASEAGIKLNILISELRLSSGETPVDDLPLPHVRLRNCVAGALGIDDHVRRVATVADPLVHGA